MKSSNAFLCKSVEVYVKYLCCVFLLDGGQETLSFADDYKLFCAFLFSKHGDFSIP